MIKITGIVIVMCILNLVAMNMYMRILPTSDVMRIELKQLKPFEKIWFMLTGWLIIITPICVAISAIILIFRYL